MTQSLHAVTGAFGYSGKYIAKRLLDRGHKVITLTNSPYRENPFEGSIKSYPFNFDNPNELTESLRGVSVLYNTYWVRFNYKMFQHADAVRNTMVLFEAAKAANIERIIHVSITNPSEESPLEYFSGKAKLERALIDTGISYAILRPTVMFGKEDILINNIAWALRRFPVFGVFGSGEYRLQPIYVDDLAEIAVRESQSNENKIIDAIGPETFTYKELVEVIGKIIGKERMIISLNPTIGYYLCNIMSKFVNDVIITKEEIKGLMDNLLYVDSPPAGKTKLTEWVKKHSDEIGKKYTSELLRRIDRKGKYKSN